MVVGPVALVGLLRSHQRERGGHYPPLIDRDIFPAPPWMLAVDAIEARDWDHARRIADEHRDKVALMDHVHLKLAYFSGVLDGTVMQETAEG